MRARQWIACALFVLPACAGTQGSGSTDDGSPAPPDAGTSADVARGPEDAASAPDADAAPPADAQADAAPKVEIGVVSRTHRAIPGVMFGGWGPHLGHLVRVGASAWFVDDGCDASGADVCDVNVDRRIEYRTKGPSGWTLAATQALPPGVQQNTATIVKAGTIYSYGVDVALHSIVECTFDPATLARACADVAPALPDNSNYVGAAVSPAGYKVVWYTVVQDGGGGAFHWMVDYGGGWNGPRVTPLGSYNDASYINIAFGGGAAASRFVMHAQLVGGLAPNWTFFGAIGDGDSATAGAVPFSLLSGDAADPIISTNDVTIDPATGDAHVIARTNGGASAYFFRRAGGAWGAPAWTLAGAYRARWEWLADGRLALVYGLQGKGLFYRVFGAHPAGAPLALGDAPERAVEVPAGYSSLEAIYPESTAYQGAPSPTIHVALVGGGDEHEVLGVEIQP